MKRDVTKQVTSRFFLPKASKVFYPFREFIYTCFMINHSHNYLTCYDECLRYLGNDSLTFISDLL